MSEAAAKRQFRLGEKVRPYGLKPEWMVVDLDGDMITTAYQHDDGEIVEVEIGRSALERYASRNQ